MKSSYKAHLTEIQTFWKEHLLPEDLVIDATCGNGQDTFFLSKLAHTVYAIDIQQEAISKAKLYATSDNVKWYCQSHETFPEIIKPESIALITYNLGYLPGGNKEIITQTNTTLKSVENGLSLLKAGGAMTLMCYPGHQGGDEEEQAILKLASSLESSRFLVSYTQWPNRKKHPSLFKLVKLFPV